MAEAINLELINHHTTKLIEPKSELDDRTIDLRIKYPEINYLFLRNGQPCFSLGDIQAVKGKAKSGKSTFMIGLLSSLLGTEYLGFKAVKSGCNVIYIDTEQNPINTVKMVKKVHFICGLSENLNDERFITLNLRGDLPVKRKFLILEAIAKYKPNLIIIDGVKDLVEGGDINAPKESSETIQFLMTITKDCNLSILTVLHENKGDENMRGHLGTELLNKCSEVWQIKKTEDLFQAQQIENRNEASRLINFGFRFDEHHMPVLVDANPVLNSAERIYQKKIERFYYCLQPGTSRTYTDLKKEYCEAYGCGEKTAEKDIATLLVNNYLEKDKISKEYRFNPYKVPQININSTSAPPP